MYALCDQIKVYDIVCLQYKPWIAVAIKILLTNDWQKSTVSNEYGISKG